MRGLKEHMALLTQLPPFFKVPEHVVVLLLSCSRHVWKCGMAQALWTLNSIAIEESTAKCKELVDNCQGLPTLTKPVLYNSCLNSSVFKVMVMK